MENNKSLELIKAEIEKRKKGNMYDELPTTIGRYYEDRDLLAFIDSLPEEKPSYVTDSPGDPGNPGEPGISDLEEAAEERARKIYPYEGGTKGLICENAIPIYKAGFIAGAEWQARQLLKGSPLPEDTVLFHKGVEEGKRLMMEDAVEIDVADLNGEIYNNCIEKGMTDEDKVKIIIVDQDAARRK